MFLILFTEVPNVAVIQSTDKCNSNYHLSEFCLIIIYRISFFVVQYDCYRPQLYSVPTKMDCEYDPERSLKDYLNELKLNGWYKQVSD